ncbi:MAG: hypothetical protein Q4B34_02270, partial [Candidatus Saccharibacteria bacterium]|nr:hypothetical protein [Candidatus Saccharibacteria bacterium]
ATDSFAVILSEARKYGLNLTVANQYVAQMTDPVRDAVFGNVGTTISFRVSADDAPVLVKQFEPTFEASDLLQLNNRHFVISMIINGEKVPAFSATTLSIPPTPADNFERIINHSRREFGRPRAEVEAEIRETIEQAEKYKKELSDSGREAGEMSNFDRSLRNTEQKPNLKFEFTPQADFRRQNLSPNAAEGKERLGLKDLAKLVEKNKKGAPEAIVEAEKKVDKKPNLTENIKKEMKKRGKQRGKKAVSSISPTPVTSPVKPQRTEVEAKKPVSETVKPDPIAKQKSDTNIDGFFKIEH